MKKIKSSPSSHPLVAFSILIMLAGLVSADIYYYFKAHKKMPTLQPKIVVADTMVNWQTYANYDLGFQINYPANRLPIEIHPDNTTEQIVFGEIIHGPFTINVKKNTTIDEYIAQDFKDNPSCANRKNIKLNSYDAVFYTCEDEFAGVTVDNFVIAKDNNVYIINFILVPQGTTAENVKFVIDANDQKMLDSFRFTEDMSGWETYINTPYNYSFARPGDWEINSNCLMAPGREFECSDIFVNDPVKQPTSDWRRFQVQVFDDYYKNFIGDDLDAYIREIYKLNKQGGHTLSDIKPMSLNGQTGYSFITHNEFTYGEIGGQTESYPTKHIFIPKNKKLYHVFYVLDNTKFDQILSTFRFTDDMSDWQTYKNEKLHYQIQIPTDWWINEQKDFTQILPPSIEKENLPPGAGYGGAQSNNPVITISSVGDLTVGETVQNIEAERKIVINNLTSIQRQENGSFGNSINTYIPQGKSYIKFSWDLISTPSDPTLGQILSTFKFIK